MAEIEEYPTTLGQIPTIEEIKKCRNFLRSPEDRNKIVRMGPFVVKYRRSAVLLNEARSLLFLAKECPEVPVPRVFAVLKEKTHPFAGLSAKAVEAYERMHDEEERKHPGLTGPRWFNTTTYYLVMGNVEGTTLENVWKGLSTGDLDQVVEKVNTYLARIRRIPSQGYIGAVGERACVGDLFGHLEPFMLAGYHDGPYYTHKDMIENIRRRLEAFDLCEFYMDPVISRTPKLLVKEYPVVFTHGDLQNKNIMVHRKADGRLDVTIIDWESAGWYPEYLEYCARFFSARHKPDLTDFLCRILDTRTSEWENEWEVMWSIYRACYFMPVDI